MNNLDPDVAERPEDLVVYGGTGKAARNWESFDAIVSELRRLGDDETLIVQSGKPVAVFRTHTSAPRVLIANSNLVGRWATWENFRELERKGLIMYGQMTAGSWIYIGSQGIVQGTYETFGSVARRHFGGSLAGRFVLTSGLGGMGGAQPLAATMAGAAILAVEVDESRIDKRLATKYCDRKTASIDEALDWIEQARVTTSPLSVGLVGNAADVLPQLAARGIVPDVLTDQTSAHDMLNGYIPAGMPLNEALALRAAGSGEIYQALDGVGSGARRGHARAPAHGRDHVRLRKQHPHGGARRRCRERVRHSRLRAGIHQAALLRREGAVPLGRAVRRPEGHRSHRRSGARALSRRRASAALDHARARANRVSGIAGTDLLARAGRARRSSAWR